MSQQQTAQPRYFQAWWGMNSPEAKDVIIEEYPAESVPLWLETTDIDVPTLGTRYPLPYPAICVLVSVTPRDEETEEEFMDRVYNKVRNSLSAFNYDAYARRRLSRALTGYIKQAESKEENK